ncbi:MAG: thiamine-monophosphate kinase [Phycisphaerales bacterium]
MRESDFLRHVAQTATGDPRVLIPPGDDLAALTTPCGPLLTGVDQLIDGRHVDLDRVSAAAAGRKAVRRCISDLAAMAARPWATLAAVVLPSDFGSSRTIELFDAVRVDCERLSCPLVGGDIAIHAADRPGPLVLSISVIGHADGIAPVRRTGARPGDRLVVTGRLGATLAPDGTGHHLEFEPRVEAARELASTLGAELHAMIDLSDGLGRDGAAVARASGVDLNIQASLLPRRGSATWREAMSDGEDYELFAAVGPDVAIPSAVDRIPLTVIGTVEAVADGQAGPRVRVTADGESHDLTDAGWDHVGDES